MTRKYWLVFPLVLLALSLPAGAQLWSGVIDQSRAIDWSGAGVVGGIVNRTDICATFSPGATAAQISTALQSTACQNKVVFLNAGTYNLTSGVNFGSVSNVTLRGAGADKTLLVFTGSTSCLGRGSLICITARNNPNVTNPANTTTWTGGYTRGSTTLTVGSSSGMAAGQILILDQTDEATDTGNIWNCATTSCTEQGGNSHGRSNRSQQQLVKVVSVPDGTHVVVTPAIRMPNWRSSQSPGIYWANVSTTSGDGVEDLSIDGTNDGMGANTGSNIVLQYVSNCWVKGVRSIKGNRNHVWILQGVHNTVRDSYFYASQYATSTSYGVEVLSGSDHLIENNIFQGVAGTNQEGGGGIGNVWGYNFSINDTYSASPNWMIASNIQHDSGITHSLTEGNDGLGFTADNIHGSHHFQTAFRNYFYGDIWNNPTKSNNTDIIHLRALSRYYNIIGNVLGRTGYYTTYQVSGDSPNAIYALGGGMRASDPLTTSTLMRWGNYDTATGTTRFVSSEVPSGISMYGNAVPASQTLPASFYLASKPAWFGTTPWPAIGGDVVGGNLSGANGHANMIPARSCWTNVMKGVIGTSGLLSFNAAACYGNSSPVPSGPAAPSGLTVSVQ